MIACPVFYLGWCCRFSFPVIVADRCYHLLTCMGVCDFRHALLHLTYYALTYNKFGVSDKQYYCNLTLRRPLLKLQVSPLPVLDCFFPRYDKSHSPQSSMNTNNPCEIRTSESQDKRYIQAQREELYSVRWSSANADRERSALPGL